MDESKEIKLSNIFLINDFTELSVIAENEFYDQLDLDRTKSLNEQGFWFTDDKFSLNNNFYINTDGLHFYFNNYEIRAYSCGPTDLIIPWSKIAHLLKKRYTIGI